MTKVSKAEDGPPVKSNAQVVPRRMFWKADDGKWLIALRCLPVEPSPGKPSIVAGEKLEEVLAVLDIVKNAIEADEMDEAIRVTAVKVKRKR